MRRSLPISLLFLAMIAWTAFMVGCSDNTPTQSAGKFFAGTQNETEPEVDDGQVALYGRAGAVHLTSSVITLQNSAVEVVVSAEASMTEKDIAANTTVPATLSGIQTGDSLEFRGVWLPSGMESAHQSGGKGFEPDEFPSEGRRSAQVFLASQVMVITGDTIVLPQDTLPVGTRLAFTAMLREIDLTTGTIAFHSWPYTGQTTASTEYFGMFMGPIITLANFAPGMWVEVIGRTAGEWILTVDSLTQISDTPPDTTTPPDTLPLGIPISFSAIVQTVSDADSNITFYGSPFIGVVTPNTQITILSFMLCAGLEGCITPGMNVAVEGITAGDWHLTLSSLTELGTPPDTTHPPDSGGRWAGYDIIRTIDVANRIVTFEQFPLVGIVAPDAHLTGEFPTTTGDLLPYFIPGMYVYLSGEMIGPDSLLIDMMAAQDYLPPDTTTPPDTTWPDSSLLPITEDMFFDIEPYVIPDDSAPFSGPRVVLKLETEESLACPHVEIFGTLDLQATSVTLNVLGVPPYECFAYEPGPAKREFWLGFADATFTVTLSYKDRSDSYTVTASGTQVAITPIGTPVWTQRKDL